MSYIGCNSTSHGTQTGLEFSISMDEPETLGRRATNCWFKFDETAGVGGFAFDFENLPDGPGYDWITTNV